MKKGTKRLIASVAVIVLLAACGFLVHMNAKVPLDKVLPQGWQDVTLTATVFEIGKLEQKNYITDEKTDREIMDVLSSAHAVRTRPFDEFRGDFFWVTVWTGEGHDMWNLALTQDGLLRITSPENRSYYFHNCQELYWQIQTIAQILRLTE